MKSKTPKFNRQITLLTLLVLCVILLLPTLAAADSDPAAAQLQHAWRLAQDSGRYSYRSLVDQMAYPAPLLANAGKSPTQDKLSIEGWVDLPSNEMEMTLWQDGSFDPNNGVAIRVEGDQAFGRVGQDEWQEVDNIANIFAPGGDPLSFLAGIKNVQAGNIHNASVGAYELQLTQYTFDIDGPTFANHMRQQMQQQLREQGRLPNGMQFSPSELYRSMTGRGELWLDTDGLPNRLIVNLDMPPQNGNGRIVATITTDYYEFDLERITGLGATLFADPQTWIAYRLPDAQASQEIAIHAGLWLLAALIGLICIANWRSRKIYGVVAMVIVASLLFTPLLQGEQVYAFYNEQQAKQAVQAERLTESKQTQAVEDALQTNWDPHLAPVKQFAPENKELSAHKFAIQNSVTTITTDSDGDGLSDADEDKWLTCAYVGAPINCDGITDPTDSDGDGLIDGVEVNSLGIIPSRIDSDNDTISDKLEVEGFSYNGQMWYTDPLEGDTNHDGRPDGLECSVWSTGSDEFDPTAICPDTDGDGVPDLFDNDNDGDNVEDKYDLSPDSVSNTTFDGDNPFSYTIENLQIHKPVLVDFQLRPVDANHLSYQTRILDWPSGDSEGQIQRVLDTTFATTDNLDIRTNSLNAANGDIRFVPMLEVTMPFQSGHYANLPVLDGHPSSRGVGPVGDWLDTTELDPYGIIVRDVDESATDLVAYVPVNLVSGSQGEGLQAFTSRMIYYPEQGTSGLADWGLNAHEVRLVWLVQMITDRCQDDTEDPDTCQRVDTLDIVHVYDEEWQLTGMSVSEEHGLDVAWMYEDPTVDDDRQLDDQLWMVSWNLNNTFMRGRDCLTMSGGNCNSDGIRDVTIDNLDQRINEWSGGSSFVQVETQGYLHQGYGAFLGLREIPDLLETVFTPYAADTTPTILVAQEKKHRLQNLDTAVISSGGDVTITFDDVATPETTMVGLNWAPYQYKNGAWTNYNVENYLTLLESQLSQGAVLFPLGTPAEEQEALLNWAQTYYTAFFFGFVGTVEIGGELVWVELDGALDESFSLPDWGPLHGGTFTVADGFISKLAVAWGTIKSADAGFYKWDKFFKYARHNELSLDEASDLRFVQALEFNDFALTTAMALAVAGATLVVVGYFWGNDTLVEVGTILIAVGALIIELVQIVLLVSQVYILVQAGMTLLNSLRAVAAANSTMSKWSVIGAGLGLLALWGIVGFAFYRENLGVNSVDFHTLLASATAASIVMIIFIVLGFIPIVGQFIVAIVSLIDFILYLFGKKGISEYMTEWISHLLYDVDYIITNMKDPDRLQINIQTMHLLDQEIGLTAGNSISFTLAVTNTVKYHHNSPASDAREATFAYHLQEEAVDQHETLVHGSMADEWVRLDGRFLQMTTALPYTHSIPLSSIGSGINRNFDGYMYLTESFVQPYEGCWLAFGFETDCQISYFDGSAHLNLGEVLVYDILPDTIGEFVALAWNNSEAMPFPPQKDFDGDGLLSKMDGGVDPDDSQYDTDGDGLSDRFELNIGTNPEEADSDHDGLMDDEELRYHTNPLHSDFDGDGLTDYVEAKLGWLAQYDTNSTGQALYTRVWSDPFTADMDQDTLGDLQEFAFGGNPWIPTNPSIIERTITFDDIEVTEYEAPILLARFEEPANSLAFADSSGEGHITVCNPGGSCPVTGVDGIYGSAIQFNSEPGVFINTLEPDLLDMNTADFSIGAWVKTTSGGHFFSIADDDGSFSPGERSFNVGSGLTFGSGPDFIQGDGTVNDGQWHHVMIVWDYDENSQDGNGFIYLDGTDVTTVDSYDDGTPTNPNSTIRIGASPYNASFKGTVDEFVVFDRALTAAEVAAVMNGRYNPNDGLTSPGAQLSYQTAVTNTSPSQAADGFLSAQAHYVEPALPRPEIALHFETDDYLPGYVPSSGKSPFCLSSDTCPQFVPGVNNSAANFDGINDRMRLPRLGEAEYWHVISFWVNVNDLPAAGSGARDHILYGHNNPDADRMGRLSIYLDPAGVMTFDVGPDRTADEFDCHTDNCVDDPNPHYELSHQTTLFTDPQNLNKWHHILFEYTLGEVPTSYRTASNIFIDGVHESTLYYDQYTDDRNFGLIIGDDKNALLGGNPFSSASHFNGQLDELVVFSGPQSLSRIGNDPAAINAIMNGDYYIKRGVLNPASYPYYNDIIPQHYIGMENIEPTAVLNDVDNLPTAFCPALTACPQLNPAGKFGSSIAFDGIDDHLSLGELEFATGDYTLGGWFKSAASGPQTILGALDKDNHWLPGILVEITSSGQLRYLHRLPTGETGPSEIVSTGAVNDGQWHYFTAVRQANNLVLYLDGQIAGTGTHAENSTEPLNVHLGRLHHQAPQQFAGQMDEIIIIPAAVDSSEVQHLMNGSWPAIQIEEEIVEFNVPAQTTITANGLAQVNETALSGWQQIDEEVDAVLQLPINVNIPINGDNADQLVAYLPFDLEVPGDTVFDDATDLTDFECYNNDITYCPTIDFNGLIGQAAYFDGNDSIHATTDNDMGESFAFWVKALDVSNGGYIIDTRGIGNQLGWALAVNHARAERNWIDYKLYYDLPVNEWVHIAVVGRNYPRLYWNGEFRGYVPISGYMQAGDDYTGPITLGSAHNGTNPFNGFIDDFRSYDVDLTADEVFELYQNSSPRLYFAFDEESDATFFQDSSPNQYIGYPNSNKNCAGLTINQITVNDLSSNPSHLKISLNGETLWEDDTVSIGEILSPSFSTLLCGGQKLEMTNVSANAITDRVVNANNAGNYSQSFNVGGEAVTIDYDIGESATVVNPLPGTDGKLGNTALFTGPPIIVNPADDSNLDLDELTIMLWVSPDGIVSNGWQNLIEKSANNGSGIERNYQLVIPPNTLKVDFSSQRSDCATWVVAQSNSSLVANQWNHVAVTFTPDMANLYINGVLDKSQNFNTPVDLCQNDGPIRIGGLFGGEMDELALFGRAMSAEEIFSAYMLQLRSYSDTGSTLIQIDNDTPTINLLSDYAYRPKGYTQLAVSTADATSRVTILTMGIKAPGTAEFTWQGVQRCQEGDANSVVWCPAFDSSTLAGEGLYEIQFRAVDAVGHESFSSVYPIIVDDTAPTVSSSYSGDLLTAIDDPDTEFAWTIPLDGTVEEPAVSAVAGSGILTETAVISLVDSAGQILNGVAQPLVIEGNSWSVDYAVSGARPYDTYTIQITVEDAVGNVTTSSVGTVRLDERPPHADLNSWQISDLAISKTTTLSGTVSEQAHWAGELARYHFEEAAGSTTFADNSGNAYHGSCTNCPTITAGLFGQALAFDGVDDSVDLTTTFNPISETFSLSLWFYVDANETDGGVLVQQTDGSGQGRTLLFLNGNNKLRSNLGLGNGTILGGATTVTPDAWHHAVFTFDGTTGKLYLDGKLDGAGTLLAEAADGALNLGSNRGSSMFFHGLIDEAAVYDRVLSDYEIYALTQTENHGVSSVEISVESFDPVSGTAALENWQPATVDNPGATLSTWSYTLPDVTEGFYQIRLRSSDADSNGENGRVIWRGAICDIVAQCTTVLTAFVSYLPFDEGNGNITADKSNNGNDGVLNGNILWSSDTPSGNGYVLDFDGFDDYVELANESQFDLNVMSVALWLKVDNFTTNWQAMITKGDGAWRIHRCNGQQTISFGTSGLSNGDMCSNTTLDDGQWHHVVAVFDGSTKYLYIDGELDNSLAVTGSININDYPVMIGNNAQKMQRYFNGMIDEVRIYDQALMEDDVSILYNASSNPSE